MTEKVAEKYIYHGLGFPLELRNVKMFRYDNEDHPIIDVKKTADFAVELLSTQKEKMTGNQLYFIRTDYLKMTVNDLANLVKKTSREILAWEKTGNKPAKIDNEVEALLKQHLHATMLAKKPFSNTLLTKKGMFAIQPKKPISLPIEPDQSASKKKKR